MSTVNLGQIKPVFKGAYNNSTAYVLDNIVTSAGSSYICILASSGNAVSNSTYWTQMSAAGTNGTNGTNASTSASDLTSGTLPIARIADGAVTTAKINADAITGAKIADDAIGEEHLEAGAVVTAAINDDAVTAAKMANSIKTEFTTGAWLNYKADSSNAIRDSYNISSVGDNASGKYTANFATSFNNNDYAWSGIAGYPSGTNNHIVSHGTYTGGYTDGSDMTTSLCKFYVIYIGSGHQDVEIVTISWHGDIG